MKIAYALFLILLGLGSISGQGCELATPSKPYRMSVCTMIKNEARYIQEWLEYHMMKNVDHFFIYDDGSTDNISVVLKPYVERGIVSHLYWHNNRTVDEDWVWKDPVFTRNQRFCIADCVFNKRAETQYVGLWDVDEFPDFTHENMSNFHDLIDKYIIPTKIDNLQIPLTIMGSSGFNETPSGLITELYTHRSVDMKFGFSERRNKFLGKSMYKTGCAQADVHHSHKLQEGCRHQSYWPDMVYSPDYPVHFKHYFSKSFQDFTAKQKKWGWTPKISDFRTMEKTINEVEDTRLTKFASAIKQGIACRKPQ